MPTEAVVTIVAVATGAILGKNFRTLSEGVLAQKGDGARRRNSLGAG